MFQKQINCTAYRHQNPKTSHPSAAMKELQSWAAGELVGHTGGTKGGFTIPSLRDE